MVMSAHVSTYSMMVSSPSHVANRTAPVLSVVRERVRWDVVKRLLTPGSAEGPFTCSNMTVQYNDIGPCGSDSFQQVSEHGCSCRWESGLRGMRLGDWG
jgi:hypothetical protein